LHFRAMSAEQLAAFFEKVKADPVLEEKLKAAAGLDAAAAVAKEAGFAVDAADLMGMSDEQVTDVAGGHVRYGHAIY
jgi:predicted ribosomally synthesized peptide with nif11-like leader